MWRRYFKVVKVKPGRIITPRHGTIDLSRENLPIEVLKELYEEDWPYIEITDEGMDALYGKPADTPPESKPVPDNTNSDSDATLPEENVTEYPVNEPPVARRRKITPKSKLTE